MKTISLLTAVASYILISCIHPIENIEDSSFNFNTESLILNERIPTPESYSRLTSEDNSFQNFLQNLTLKSADEKVKYFNGKEKANNNVYCAVVDLEIGKRDLHQCADAIMRLRAEHLFEQKKYTDIHFNFTNGFNAEYSKWKAGNRIQVNGKNVSWKSGYAASESYESFWKYLEMVFSYAGTASLSKELNPTPIAELSIGDVFIQGGFPGHAVIVVDICESKENGKKKFLLAQSYMPAQEIQILQNPNSENESPWYDADFGEILETPEWIFNSSDLKSF